MIVRRGRRDDLACDFDRETTFVQNIGILDVANEVNADKAGDSIEVIDEKKNGEIKDEKGDEKNEAANAIDAKGEENEKSNLIVILNSFFGFFACFVRTCSCNLMLLSNLLLQRLQM